MPQHQWCVDSSLVLCAELWLSFQEVHQNSWEVVRVGFLLSNVSATPASPAFSVLVTRQCGKSQLIEYSAYSDRV